MRGLVVVLCALALAPTAFARPYLGLALGDSNRFTTQTGQRTALRNIYLGWDQGYRWGSSFDRIIPKLGRVPLVSVTTFHWPSKKETLTPLQIAKVVAFFVASDFVTGETVRVDGGRHVK